MPRIVHYVGACLRQQVCTLELCGSAADVIRQAWGTFGEATPCGLTFELARSSVRDQWTIVQSAPRPVARVVSEWEVVRDLALALRLSGPAEGEVYRTWYARVAPSQAVVLSSSQLFV